MFRLGTTSYIIPADILPNVEYLAGKVRDIQLVLFETDEYGGNLPDAPLRRRLRELAAAHGLTYSVHLPLDLRLTDGGAAAHLSLEKARKVIDATLELEPSAYTVHLDGRRLPAALGGDGSQTLADWQAEAKTALLTVAGWLPDPALLGVENLEKWNPDAFAPVVEALPVSRTVDIGHLWLEKRDVLASLDAWLPKTRVIHLHGVAARDHAALTHAPRQELEAVLRALRERFHGILTVEVFNEADFTTSMDLLRALGFR